MGDTALARHQSLIERQMGNIIKNMSKEKGRVEAKVGGGR
jgi:hypothetical protein